MLRSLLTAAGMLAFALGQRAPAQSPIELRINGTLEQFSLGAENVNPKVPVPKSGNVQIVITCKPPFDCTSVKWVGDAAKRLSPGEEAPSPTRKVFALPGGPAAVSFTGQVSHTKDGKESTSTNQVEFTSGSASDPENEDGKTLAEQVAKWLATPCRPPTSGELGVANIILTPFGQPLRPIMGDFTNDGRVTVAVLADDRVKHLLTIREGSDIAQPVINNVYGSDVPPFKRTSTGATAPKPPTCSLTEPVALGPFASPKGVVEVAAYNGEDTKAVGTRQFRVIPVYTGAFALGAVSSNLAAPSFSKVFNGSDTVVTELETGRRVLFTATYTHFWRKRDLVGKRTGIDYLPTPLVGIVLNDVASNVLYGVNIELKRGLSIVAGGHTGLVKEIDERSGAVVGEAYENRSAEVPTNKHWKTKGFWGVVLDANAAAGLLQSLFAGNAK